MSIYGSREQQSSSIFGGQSLNDVITVDGPNSIFVPYISCTGMTAGVIYCDTIYATNEYIDNITSQDITGYVKATQDVWASWNGVTGGTGTSLIETAASISSLSAGQTGQAAEIADLQWKTQNISLTGTTGASGGATILNGDLRFVDQEDVTRVRISANGINGNGDLVIATSAGQGIGTSFLTTSSATFPVSGPSTINAGLNVSGDVELTGDVDCSGTIQASKFRGIGSLIPFSIDTLGQTGVFYIDSEGNTICNSILLPPTDLALNGSDGSISCSSISCTSTIRSGAYTGGTGSFQYLTVANHSGASGSFSNLSFNSATGGSLSCESITAGTLAVTGAVSGATGTFSSFSLPGSLTSFISGDGSAQPVGLTGNNIIYMSAAGSDSNNGLSTAFPVASLTQALVLAGNSGKQVRISPGTYVGDTTITNLNVSIVTGEPGGLVNFTGQLTFAHSSSSVRVEGITANVISHSGAGGLYLINCTTLTGLVTSGSGYLQCVGTSSALGVTNVTGTGNKNFLSQCQIGLLTVNNAGAVVNCSNCLLVVAPSLVAGTLGMSDTVLYAVSSGTNALTTTGGTLILQNISCNTPTNTQARIGIGASTTYSFRSVWYDSANSTISGSRAAQTEFCDQANIASLTTSGLTVSGDLLVNGNVNIGGTGTVNNWVTQVYENVVIESVGMTGPALQIKQVGVTGAAPIFEVWDQDSNIKFSLNQDCDLNLNSKFTVDSASGDTVTTGTLAVAGVTTLSERLTLASFSGTGLTGAAAPVNGQLAYNTTANQVWAYQNGAWGQLGGGGSFTPVISNLTASDSLYYDGTNWVNGYAVDAPTCSAVQKMLSSSAISTPYTLTPQYTQYQIYASDGTTLLYDSGDLAYNSSYTQNALSLGTTYKGRSRIKCTRANSTSPWSSLLTFTPSDAIAAQLTTSLSAYNAASANAFVSITSTEYNAIVANVPGASLVGNTTLTNPGSNYDGANRTLSMTSLTTQSYSTPPYIIAFRCVGSGQAGTCNVGLNLSSAPDTLQANSMVYTFAPGSLANGTTYYFCLKAPTLTTGGAGSGARFLSVRATNNFNPIIRSTNTSTSWWGDVNPFVSSNSYTLVVNTAYEDYMCQAVGTATVNW